MQCTFAFMRTELLEFKSIGNRTLIAGRGVITALALSASQYC